MENLELLLDEARASIENAPDSEHLETLRLTYLGKKGAITTLLQSLGKLPGNERKEAGQKINLVKTQIMTLLNQQKIILEEKALNQKLKTETIDISLPGTPKQIGSQHPVKLTISRIETFFEKLGFTIETGPEIEDSFHNFDALNIASDHPARSDHDTFFFNPDLMLRTHTSGVQIRTLENNTPPLRFIAPGKVYRNDYDQTHTPMFHQIEGMLIDKNINFAQLKKVIRDFLIYFFEDEALEIRFRPSYFPFTEPSAEVDIKGKNGKWLEVLGCGMTHPNVLKSVNIDSQIYSGFAFGLGVERLTMLRYNVTDLRSFFENDLRFLTQFK